MKKYLLLLPTILFFLISNAQIELNTVGQVGIGIAPISPYRLALSGDIKIDNGSYIGFIIGGGSNYDKAIYPTSNNYGQIGKSNMAFKYIYSYNYYQLSDRRQKENIKDINNALKTVLSLKGVKYDIKKEYAYDSISTDNKQKEKIEKKRKGKIGFLAQDVNLILPEVVDYDDSTDVYSINYSRVIPILVEAIREQQLMIEELKSKKDEKGQKSGEIEVSSQNLLCQNAPNPFTESTVIKYALAENIESAMLNIYNMNGTQLKSIAIQHTGNGSITINGNEFGAGMYMYALIADGNIVDTKNMVLTN